MATEKRMIDANDVEFALDGICNRESGIPLAVAEWLANIVRKAPTVDAMEVVHGRWILKEHPAPYGGYHLFHCSECDEPNAREKNYCPNCGAKMDGVADG